MNFLSENHAWNTKLFRARPLHKLPVLTSTVSYAGRTFPSFCQPVQTDAGHFYAEMVRGSEKINFGPNTSVNVQLIPYFPIVEKVEVWSTFLWSKSGLSFHITVYLTHIKSKRGDWAHCHAEMARRSMKEPAWDQLWDWDILYFLYFKLLMRHEISETCSFNFRHHPLFSPMISLQLQIWKILNLGPRTGDHEQRFTLQT